MALWLCSHWYLSILYDRKSVPVPRAEVMNFWSLKNSCKLQKLSLDMILVCSYRTAAKTADKDWTHHCWRTWIGQPWWLGEFFLPCSCVLLGTIGSHDISSMSHHACAGQWWTEFNTKWIWVSDSAFQHMIDSLSHVDKALFRIFTQLSDL